MLSKTARIRILRDSLRYWQGRYRMESRWLRQTRAKRRELVAEIVKLRKEGKHERGSLSDVAGTGT